MYEISCLWLVSTQFFSRAIINVCSWLTPKGVTMHGILRGFWKCEWVDGFLKRYFILDQQIAWHFVHWMSLQTPFSYVTQIINPFLTSRLSANHDTGLGF